MSVLAPPRARPRLIPAAAPARALSEGRWRLAFAAVAALVMGFAFAPFVLVALDAAAHHRLFLGVAGYYPMDGLQYLAWVRDAHDGLIRSLYGSSVGKAVFVHPMFSPSGLLQAATGVGPAAILAFWKAVSALVLLGGCAFLVKRYVPAGQTGRRTTALILTLFGGFTPVAALLSVSDIGQAGTDFARAAGDLVSAMSLWDYSPLAIALGLMPFVIDRLERIVAGRRDRRTVLTAAGLGLLVAWLHPWQGITLIAIGAGLVLWRVVESREPRRALRDLPVAVIAMSRPFVIVIAATAVPVLYYLMLSRIDSGWATSELNSVSAAAISGPVALWCVAPVALIGLFAGRRCARDPDIRGVLLWPAATMLTVLLSPSGQYRALDGLTIPVAVLVVRAWPRSAGRLKSALALTCALVPFAYFTVTSWGHFHSRAVTQYAELAPSDVRAARVAAREDGGGPVLAPVALGTAVPALTDALSWAGHPIWTPDYQMRSQQAGMLFEGELAPVKARRFVTATQARALIEPCGYTGKLRGVLQPLGFHASVIGCTTLYVRGR